MGFIRIDIGYVVLGWKGDPKWIVIARVVRHVGLNIKYSLRILQYGIARLVILPLDDMIGRKKELFIPR